MAQQAIAAGLDVTLFARRPSALESFRDSGAHIAHSLADLGAQCELVCIAVVNDTDVEEVLDAERGVLAGMRPGSIAAVHSTVTPELCVRLTERALGCGVALLDAPVSNARGPETGAISTSAAPSASTRRRALLMMVGGDEIAFNRGRHVFATYANPVLYIGPSGSALRTKLINNLLLYSGIVTACDALQLASDQGLDPRRVLDAVGNGSGRSYAIEIIESFAEGTEVSRWIDAIRDDFATLLQKDLELFIAFADQAPNENTTALKLIAERALQHFGTNVPRDP
jgi:3-hydroxyisobutyrate dehydrogenase-like beta-hydroxyacid dehydrogenase